MEELSQVAPTTSSHFRRFVCEPVGSTFEPRLYRTRRGASSSPRATAASHTKPTRDQSEICPLTTEVRPAKSQGRATRRTGAELTLPAAGRLAAQANLEQLATFARRHIADQPPQPCLLLELPRTLLELATILREASECNLRWNSSSDHQGASDRTHTHTAWSGDKCEHLWQILEPWKGRVELGLHELCGCNISILVLCAATCYATIAI